MPKISDIVGIINKIAPPHLAEQWDNSGLQLGDPTTEVNHIMVALDPTVEVIHAALSASCQLLITHHPLIFKPLKKITTATAQGRLIHTAIKGNLAVMSIHTCFDSADGGMNDLLAARLGLRECLPLIAPPDHDSVKLVVFVPTSHLDAVRTALFPYTTTMGNYRDCSFSAPGIGTFTPQSGAQPFIGTPGSQTSVEEYRLEVLIQRNRLSNALRTLVSVHPYEEPVFDIYPLAPGINRTGLGRIGTLAEPCTLAEFAHIVATVLDAPDVRIVGEPTTRIRSVAVCGGSGASLVNNAVRAGADVLVTGDVKYHDARDAAEQGIAIIDGGHFATEIGMVASVSTRLQTLLSAAGYSDCHVTSCGIESDPFCTTIYKRA